MTEEQAYRSLKQAVTSCSTVPVELIEQLFAICNLVYYSKGEHFLHSGTVPEFMGFNLDGYFRLYYIDNNGNDLIKGFCTPGKFVVSYSAMVQRRPSYFSIESLSNSYVLKFNYHTWMDMINRDFRWYPFVFRILQSVYIMKEMREKSFLLDDATTRYLQLQQEFPGIEKKVKLYHIASYIGITPEALSRIRRSLKNHT